MRLGSLLDLERSQPPIMWGGGGGGLPKDRQVWPLGGGDRVLSDTNKCWSSFTCQKRRLRLPAASLSLPIAVGEARLRQAVLLAQNHSCHPSSCLHPGSAAHHLTCTRDPGPRPSAPSRAPFRLTEQWEGAEGMRRASWISCSDVLQVFFSAVR